MAWLILLSMTHIVSVSQQQLLIENSLATINVRLFFITTVFTQARRCGATKRYRVLMNMAAGIKLIRHVYVHVNVSVVQ